MRNLKFDNYIGKFESTSLSLGRVKSGGNEDVGVASADQSFTSEH